MGHSTHLLGELFCNRRLCNTFQTARNRLGHKDGKQWTIALFTAVLFGTSSPPAVYVFLCPLLQPRLRNPRPATSANRRSSCIFHTLIFHLHPHMHPHDHIGDPAAPRAELKTTCSKNHLAPVQGTPDCGLAVAQVSGIQST